ncbi:MAG: hypothetical protein DRP08_08225, partial [Candidatus Aenigmatarchaeota archaeon]
AGGEERLIHHTSLQDARKQAEKEQQQTQALYEAYLKATDNYNQDIAAVQGRVMGAIETSKQVASAQRDDFVREFNIYFDEMKRGPPAIIRVGNVLHIQGQEDITLFSVNGQTPTELMEFYTTRVENSLDSVSWATTNQVVVNNFLKAAGIDAYFGTVQAEVAGAPYKKYVAFGVRLEPEEANTIANLLVGYEKRNRYKEWFQGNNGDKYTERETQHYIILADYVGYKGDKVTLGISGIYEAEIARQNELYKNGQLDTTTDYSGDMNRLYGLHGVMKVDASDNVRLIAEAGIVKAEGYEESHIDVVDIYVDEIVGTSDMDIAARDEYNFQKFAAEIKTKNDVTLNLSFTREEIGTDDIWGSQENHYVGIGLDHLKLGSVEVSAGYDHAVKSEGTAKRGNIQASLGPLSGFYARVDDAETYGAQLQVAKGLNVGVRQTSAGNWQYSIQGATELPGDVQASAALRGDQFDASLTRKIFSTTSKDKQEKIEFKAAQRSLTEEDRNIVPTVYDSAQTLNTEFQTNPRDTSIDFRTYRVDTTLSGDIVVFGEEAMKERLKGLTDSTKAGMGIYFDKPAKALPDSVAAMARPLSIIGQEYNEAELNDMHISLGSYYVDVVKADGDTVRIKISDDKGLAMVITPDRMHLLPVAYQSQYPIIFEANQNTIDKEINRLN